MSDANNTPTHDPFPTHQPGDVVNNYQLGLDNQWHPLPSPLPPVPAEKVTSGRGALWTVIAVLSGLLLVVGVASMGGNTRTASPAAPSDSTVESVPNTKPDTTTDEAVPGTGVDIDSLTQMVWDNMSTSNQNAMCDGYNTLGPNVTRTVWESNAWPQFSDQVSVSKARAWQAMETVLITEC